MKTLSEEGPRRNREEGRSEVRTRGAPLAGATPNGCPAAARAPLPATAPWAEPGSGADPAKRLSQVITAARPWFLAVEIDDLTHVARGLVPEGDGQFRVGTLAYDPSWGLLRIDVRLPRCDRSSEAHIQACLALNARTRVTRLWWDAEDALIWLRAAAICRRLDEDARFILRKVARDVHRTLRDDLLRNVIADGPYGEPDHRANGGNSR